MDEDARDHDPVTRDGESEPRGDDIDIDAVRRKLEALERTVDHPDERREVRRAIGLVDRLPTPSIRDGIRKFTRRDIAEAFVGSILISLPLLVEDGVFDIADHFVGTPAFLGANVVFLITLTTGLLYYADFRDVKIHRPIFGVIPRRLTAVVIISFVTATFTMTLWGRLDGWSDPLVALARISVVWTAAAFGGALGDILPGESEGADINDELDQFGERLGIGDDEGLF
ncbi:MAG: DUF2391 domain-containing protein [Halobacteriota archaeon]|uniref:DUF2391 domain-containing protein n=1 Tax=Natronomonas sp. TaxID=2184060 RepID=UPI00397478EB